jgi:two-component system chemotaxis sensor kinase CheA
VTLDGVATRILRLDRLLKVSPCPELASMHLVLPKFTGQPVGLLIRRVIDTESLAIELQSAVDAEPGILGSAIIRDKLTLLLDVHHLRQAGLGHAPPPAASAAAGGRARRVLLVDDTPFFRKVVAHYLEQMGLAVTTAVDGRDALDKLDRPPGGEFELIVSDIEMPVMNGWEFAERVRKLGHRMPLMALTSLKKADNQARARACGFDAYEEKLNRDSLLAAVANMLSGAAEG